jgi:surface polysaccharide O-acyltransferase-like enzyme
MKKNKKNQSSNLIIANIAGSKVRESNFELLRLLCMLLILCFHFCSHGLHGGPFYETNPLLCQKVFWSIGAIAVICFILISGYFSIKAKWKGFLHLYLMFIFYALIFTIAFGFDNGFSIKKLVGVFLPISHSKGLWFISCYFQLFLLSPFLNMLAEKCTKQKFILLLMTLGVLNCYLGYLWGDQFNPTGFDTMTFVFVYMIGRFIALHTLRSTTKKTKFVSFSIYIICGMIIFGLAKIVSYFNNIELYKKVVAYHSPLMILQAISIFIFFRALTIQNKAINWTASSVLAAYLITEMGYFKPHFWNFVITTSKIETVDNQFILGISIFLISLIVLILCICFDKIRQFITKPIETILNKVNINGLLGWVLNRIVKMI